MSADYNNYSGVTLSVESLVSRVNSKNAANVRGAIYDWYTDMVHQHACLNVLQDEFLEAVKDTCTFISKNPKVKDLKSYITSVHIISGDGSASGARVDHGGDFDLDLLPELWDRLLRVLHPTGGVYNKLPHVEEVVAFSSMWGQNIEGNVTTDQAYLKFCEDDIFLPLKPNAYGKRLSVFEQPLGVTTWIEVSY
jgi:hypothetical protein